jgi:hypothetical protein
MTWGQMLTGLIVATVVAPALPMGSCGYGLGRIGQHRVVMSCAGNRPAIRLMMSGEA